MRDDEVRMMNKDFDGDAESSRQIGNPSLGQVDLLRTLAPRKKVSWRGPWVFVIVQGLVRRKSRLVVVSREFGLAINRVENP